MKIQPKRPKSAKVEVEVQDKVSTSRYNIMSNALSLNVFIQESVLIENN